MLPAEFKAIRRDLGLSTRDLAHIFAMNEKTIRIWERPGMVGPHPTAARVMRWMEDGWTAPLADVVDFDAEGFAAARMQLGLSQEWLAEVLNVPVPVILVWENLRGPHPAACAVVSWMLAGFSVPMGDVEA